jgi:hypothetical protein
MNIGNKLYGVSFFLILFLSTLAFLSIYLDVKLFLNYDVTPLDFAYKYAVSLISSLSMSFYFMKKHRKMFFNLNTSD